MKKIKLLEKMLAGMNATKALLTKKGYNFENKAQLFIKPEDSKAVALVVACDLEKSKKLSLHFTQNNEKLGIVPSIALSPWLTCNNKACFECGTCYGLKQKYLSFFKFVYMIENTLLLMNHPEEFKKQVNAYIALTGCNYFRWFENGDFPSNESVKIFDEIAKKNKSVKFLCMTKQYERVNDYLKETNGKYSKNLVLRFSKFTIDGIDTVPNPYNVPTTDVIEQKEDLHNGAVLCPGFSSNCGACLKCWMCKKEINFVKH